MGAMVEARITAASRWSLNGRVTAVLFQPPGAGVEVALCADGSMGDMPEAVEHAGMQSLLSSRNAASAVDGHGEHGLASRAGQLAEAGCKEEAGERSTTPPASHVGSSGSWQGEGGAPAAAERQPALASEAVQRTGTHAGLGSCELCSCSSSGQQGRDSAATGVHAAGSRRHEASCSPAASLSEHAAHLRHRPTGDAGQGKQPRGLETAGQSLLSVASRQKGSKQQSSTAVSARAGPVAATHPNGTGMTRGGVVDMLLGFGVLLGLTGVLCSGLCMLAGVL